MVKFAVNNKTHSATKVSLFKVDYDMELRMEANIRRKGKVKKMMEFSEKMIKMQEEAGVALRKAQKDIKQQADRGRKEVEEWKKGDKVMLSIKDLIFKE